MVNEFCGFKHGVIGTDKMPADTTLNNMKKADLIKLLHTAQHNYESLMWFYNNAVKVNMSQLNNNGWIPVSERLPNKNGVYQVTLKSEIVDCAYFDGQDTWHNDNRVNHGRGYLTNVVVAWLPKPEPYQPKGE